MNVRVGYPLDSMWALVLVWGLAPDGDGVGNHGVPLVMVPLGQAHAVVGVGGMLLLLYHMLLKLLVELLLVLLLLTQRNRGGRRRLRGDLANCSGTKKDREEEVNFRQHSQNIKGALRKLERGTLTF